VSDLQCALYAAGLFWVLLNIPNIPPLALVSIGSGLGIVGQQVIEKLLRAKFNKVIVDRRSKK
jgi:hypothetical protein